MNLFETYYTPAYLIRNSFQAMIFKKSFYSWEYYFFNQQHGFWVPQFTTRYYLGGKLWKPRVQSHLDAFFRTSDKNLCSDFVICDIVWTPLLQKLFSFLNNLIELPKVGMFKVNI